MLVVNALRDALMRRILTGTGMLVEGFAWGLALAPWQKLLDDPGFVARGADVAPDSGADGVWRTANTGAPLMVWWSS